MKSCKLWEQVNLNYFNFLGAYGRVKLGKKKGSNEFVAVKIMKKQDLIFQQQEGHIIMECRIHSFLKHPFIVSHSIDPYLIRSIFMELLRIQNTST